MNTQWYYIVFLELYNSCIRIFIIDPMPKIYINLTSFHKSECLSRGLRLMRDSHMVLNTHALYSWSNMEGAFIRQTIMKWKEKYFKCNDASKTMLFFYFYLVCIKE